MKPELQRPTKVGDLYFDGGVSFGLVFDGTYVHYVRNTASWLVMKLVSKLRVSSKCQLVESSGNFKMIHYRFSSPFHEPGVLYVYYDGNFTALPVLAEVSAASAIATARTPTNPSVRGLCLEFTHDRNCRSSSFSGSA